MLGAVPAKEPLCIALVTSACQRTPLTSAKKGSAVTCRFCEGACGHGRKVCISHMRRATHGAAHWSGAAQHCSASEAYPQMATLRASTAPPATSRPGISSALVPGKRSRVKSLPRPRCSCVPPTTARGRSRPRPSPLTEALGRAGSGTRQRGPGTRRPAAILCSRPEGRWRGPGGS